VGHAALAASIVALAASIVALIAASIAALIAAAFRRISPGALRHPHIDPRADLGA